MGSKKSALLSSPNTGDVKSTDMYVHSLLHSSTLEEGTKN